MKPVPTVLLVGMLFVSGCSKTKYEPEKYSADLVKKAEAGNDHAQVSLGLCYENGQGVAQDGGRPLSGSPKQLSRGIPKPSSCLGSVTYGEV